jgi:hypothetical protein
MALIAQALPLAMLLRCVDPAPVEALTRQAEIPGATSAFFKRVGIVTDTGFALT